MGFWSPYRNLSWRIQQQIKLLFQPILLPLCLRRGIYVPRHGRRWCWKVRTIFQYIAMQLRWDIFFRRMPFAFLADLQRRVRQIQIYFCIWSISTALSLHLHPHRHLRMNCLRMVYKAASGQLFLPCWTNTTRHHLPTSCGGPRMNWIKLRASWCRTLNRFSAGGKGLNY